MPEPFAVNLTTAAKMMGISPSYLYSEIQAGRIVLPLIRLGPAQKTSRGRNKGKTLVRIADIEAWLALRAEPTDA